MFIKEVEMCHICNWCEHVLLILIIVLALFVSVSWSKWVIFAAALMLLIHKFCCKPSCAPKKTKTKKRKKKK